MSEINNEAQVVNDLQAEGYFVLPPSIRTDYAWERGTVDSWLDEWWDTKAYGKAKEDHERTG